MKRTKNKSFKLDEYQKKVLSYVKHGENLFVTGKAGTGKTALLRKIKEMYDSKKVVVVLAPTGVAARNADGYTMHSFLRLPLKPYLPEHKFKPDLYQLNENGAETLRNIDIIIIDEISMVRCDMLDATDAILRHYRNNNHPFGGVQLIMFGDLYQLSPVASSDDKKVLKGCYKANEFYFFLSQALQKLNYRVVELQEIHRQDNRRFIKLLNAVRIGEINQECLKILDKRVEKDHQYTPQDSTITLTTHNYQSKKLNLKMYKMLEAPEFRYAAKIVKITDQWHDKQPVDYILRLKVGSRVMFLRNNEDKNKKYNNGTMGWVTYLSKDSITVKTDKGYSIDVKRAVWQQFDYIVDKKKKTITTHVSAEFHQYPLKLAWAVSIHKSQGLTLKEVYIDASQAFAFGQVYVALSRCKTLKGIHLLERIPSHKIIADDVVRQYFESIDEDGHVTLSQTQKKYEKEPLVLKIKSATFDRILNGVKKKHQQLIKTSEDGRKLFVHNEDGSIRPNKLWAGKGKMTNYWDMNEGNFPYIMRNYRSALFIDKNDGRQIEVEIDGTIEPYEGIDAEGYYNWGFRFRFGKIVKRKKKRIP